MFDTVLYIVTQTITSPWVYAVLIALTALDGFLMFIPAETALAIVAALAAGGESSLLLTIAAGSTGAFLGDHTAYGIGRHGLGRFSNVMRADSRARAASDWASRQLNERGGMALVARSVSKHWRIICASAHHALLADNDADSVALTQHINAQVATVAAPVLMTICFCLLC